MSKKLASVVLPQTGEIIPMPSRDLAGIVPGKVSPVGLMLPEGLSYIDWLSIGIDLKAIESGVLWWIGDWLRYRKGEYAEGYLEALGATDYNYKTLANAKWVAGKIEFSRRRENLPWSHHKEVASLPPEQQDELLDRAANEGLPVKELRALARKASAALTAPGWTSDQLERKHEAKSGLAVVASMRDDADAVLLAWAEGEGLLLRIDRQTDWGNPFEIPDDGDRGEVVTKFAKFYWPHKPTLLERVPQLAGKVLACWCYPDHCHGHIIAETINRVSVGDGTAQQIADEIADDDG